MKERLPITKHLISVGNGAVLGNDTHEFAQETTGDTYSQIGEVFAKEGLLTTRLRVSNVGGGGAAADIRVMGSLDGGKSYVVAVAEQVVNDGADALITITDYYTHLKLEAKSNVAGTPTDVSGQAAAIAG